MSSAGRFSVDPIRLALGAVIAAPLAIVPVSLLLAFGHHADPDPAPVAVLVSDSPSGGCVMFCDQPATSPTFQMPGPTTSPTFEMPTATADPKDLCPPLCEFERW